VTDVDTGSEHGPRPDRREDPTVPYDPHAHPPFAVTVDLAVLTIRDGVLKVLLVERGVAPFAGHWALPGGFVAPEEDAARAAARELAEETGLASGEFTGHLEQLRTYSAPDRDPRMRVVSVAHVAFAPDLPDPRAGSDAARALWWDLDDLDLPGLLVPEHGQRVPAGGRGRYLPRAHPPVLAFDHAEILADAVDRVAAKLEYTSLATSFVPHQFTLGELQQVYEVVWGVRLDRTNFRRKLKETPGLVVPVLHATPRLTGGKGRPATVYRAGDARCLHPPMLRPEGARARRPDGGCRTPPPVVG